MEGLVRFKINTKTPNPPPKKGSYEQKKSFSFKNPFRFYQRVLPRSSRHQTELDQASSEDVASKLMLTTAFEPLLKRLRYVGARVRDPEKATEGGSRFGGSTVGRVWFGGRKAMSECFVFCLKVAFLFGGVYRRVCGFIVVFLIQEWRMFYHLSKFLG